MDGVRKFYLLALNLALSHFDLVSFFKKTYDSKFKSDSYRKPYNATSRCLRVRIQFLLFFS